MKKLFEKIIEGVLACSGFVTSITIVLIILFLFSEALGLFNSRVIEEGYVLALNKDNKVSELTPAQIKDVFDEEITNWNEVGGQDMSIRLFRLEDITQYYTEEELGAAYEHAGVKITELVERTPGIIAFVPQQFIVRPDSVHLLQDNTISVKDVFAGAEWFPTATPAAQFGFLPLITGTLWVSLFAILIALPFGLSVAIYMSEVANSRIRNLLKPIIELLSGIPSVVYGFFGLIVIVPFIQKVFNLPVGESGLAGSIVLAIMALPTIITVTEDAMRNCPRAMREASLALGASQWQTIYKVVIPYSVSGITSGVVLGIGRAIGETMAVLMVTGNAAVIPHTILEPLRTIPATIAAELGEAPAGGAHYEALFLLGVVLFIIYKGVGVISWEFLTTAPTDGMTAGGIFPAIVGTFYLMIGSALFAFPVGVMSGIYMNEYAPKGWVVRFIRMMTNNLSGIPSIVFGLFGMALFVNYMGFGDSILAGSLTLGLLCVPLVIRTTEEALKAIPDTLREGSRALGATKLQTIWHVVLPMAMPNVITGLILALGRVSGETAPILFTCAAYFLPQLPTSILDQCMALPYHLYVISTSGTDMDAQLPLAYGTALVLIVIILLVNLLANALRKYFEKKVKMN